MASNKKPDKWEREHQRRQALYLRRIDNIYKEACREAAAIGATIGDISPDTLFSFADFPSTRKRVNDLLTGLKQSLQMCIVNGIEAEWTLANNKNSELARRVFGENIGRLTQEQYRRYFSTNGAARDAFIARRVAGLSLSDRVWRYTNQFKDEIELGLDVGIRSGRSADDLSRDLRQYLRYPDKLFRRVRDEHGNLRLSKAAQAFHPGQGVYRSSYKNARRLAATETNIAYRTADHDRWQQLDFVVGIEICLSNNHPEPDICDDLKGRYPKDFKFTGWHPHCRCHVLTILKTQEEMAADTQRILRGEPLDSESVNRVNDVPQAFKDWLADNDDRLQRAKSVPYFLADNPKYSGVQPHYGSVGMVTGTKLGRTATKAAFKAYEDMPAPTLTQAVVDNIGDVARSIGVAVPVKPMTFLEADEGRGNINYGKGWAFENNCQAAVAIHEARLRGLDVTAVGYDASQGSVTFQLGERFQDIWMHPKTGQTPQPTELKGGSFADMVGKLNKATKAQGRYHIGINMGEDGHVITAERLASGKLIYYDAQSGAFLNIEEYATRSVESFEVLKVDKLLFRTDLFKAIARVL